jgi:hypothetical protein
MPATYHYNPSNPVIVKRRTKQREAEKKKAEKAATLPTHSKAKAKEPSEDDLNPNVRTCAAWI